MKITYIISEIDKAVFFENTAISLRNEGFDVNYILINCGNGSLIQFFEKNAFNYSEIRCPSIRNSWSAIKECKTLLKKQKPNVIHCHLATANWIGLWAGKLSGIKKRIYTRHSGAPLKLHWKEKLIDKIQNWLATDIVAITKMIAELLKNQGVAASKIHLIPHGFDLPSFENLPQEEIQRVKEAYNPNNKRPVIGVIARWLELKGIEYTIDAFQELLKTHPNALLCLFGGSKEQENGASIMEKLKGLPTDSFKVVDYEQNVFTIYSVFDIYVHVPVNETSEAFGQTYVEALASGVPSIFTLSGIAPEFIEDKKNALVVPFKDANVIAKSFEILQKDSELRKSLITNGKKSVEQFSFDKYIDKLRELYV